MEVSTPLNAEPGIYDSGLFDISLCNMVIKTLFLGLTLRDSGIFEI